MRLTTLLDTLENGGSGPWPPAAPIPAQHTNPSQTLSSGLQNLPEDLDASFERVVSVLIPCREHDAELWFAERESDVEQAKALCRACPVREGCLAGAIDRGEPWGVWGGQAFVDGAVVARKRGRGRPRKTAVQ